MKKANLLAVSLVLFSTIAHAELPNNATVLSFEEIARIADNLKLQREDCNSPKLNDCWGRLIDLMTTDKITSEQAKPYLTKFEQQMKACQKAKLRNYDK